MWAMTGPFLKAQLEQWCKKHQPRIELTRSRANQSNDQAWVQQKDGMLVRRVVGYERLEGLVSAELMRELYGTLRWLFTILISHHSSSKRRSSRAPSSRSAKETLENPSHSRDNGPVINRPGLG